MCLRLTDHVDAMVRANACLGLAYVARTQRHLDADLVKPVLLRELRRQDDHRGRIQDTIEDANVFQGWDLDAER